MKKNLSGITEKDALFRDLLLEEIITDEHEYCFDRSYMSDEAWEERWGDISRSEAFKDVVNDLNNKSTVEILTDRGDQYDYVYDMNNDENDAELLKKKVVFVDLQTGGFSSATTLEDMFDTLKDDFLYQTDFTEKEILVKKHELNLFTVDSKRHFIEGIYQYEMNEPSLDLVKEWESSMDELFYCGKKDYLYDMLKDEKTEYYRKKHVNKNMGNELER